MKINLAAQVSTYTFITGWDKGAHSAQLYTQMTRCQSWCEACKPQCKGPDVCWRCAESCADLQAMLDSLSCYCDKWNLSVNTKKSYIGYGVWWWQVRFKCFAVYVQGSKLECVDKFRYLGVIFSRSCSFDLCVDTLTKSGQKAIMAMLSRAQL